MRKIAVIGAMALLLGGCNSASRVFDSEISAINRQTEVLREQNRVLARIAVSLEKIEKHRAERMQNAK